MEWKTIDTAPKDGSIIRLGISGDIQFCGYWRGEDKSKVLPLCSGFVSVATGGPLDTEPTHWQPLLAESA